MTRSLANKIRRKEHMYTFSMAKGTPIQTHLDEFNFIITDIKSLVMKLKDESNAIGCLTASFL